MRHGDSDLLDVRGSVHRGLTLELSGGGAVRLDDWLGVHLRNTAPAIVLEAEERADAAHETRDGKDRVLLDCHVDDDPNAMLPILLLQRSGAELIVVDEARGDLGFLFGWRAQQKVDVSRVCKMVAL
jgi:hypothetical protein